MAHMNGNRKQGPHAEGELPHSSYPLHENRQMEGRARERHQKISGVGYLKRTNDKGEHVLGFVAASSKVAPRAATTIPRLDLCAALNASIAANRIARELGILINNVLY